MFQTPTIGRGTQLSIGEVQSIKHDCVVMKYKGSEFTVSHAMAARIHEEDEGKRNVDSTTKSEQG